MSNSPEKTPEQLHAEAQKKIDDQRAAAAAAIPPSATSEEIHNLAGAVTGAVAAAGVPLVDLERTIEEILARRKRETIDKYIQKEPDYSKLSESQIYSPDVYIPVIEHDLPDYMNMKLQDTEYVCVWANRDQRRLGELFAQGYEFLKREHVAREFQCPLKFDSEGMYVYQDVVCLRVHKRIRYAKLRRIQMLSQQQLKPANAKASAKATLMEKVILGDPALDAAFSSGAYKFYDTETT